eukprot:CAMPEP_0201573206 /NCGR_PEP_ID=MMETSP0190_2-20130828/16921_1 /ASSEMBLY_ACC=CAM_ASM_000263 /TAXON_ID=37353 /ORGANISM="Rosalina sp." /LENGTH=127 /DNA_ID=CAMNT_0047999881 /DNA_START=100 /DNA_END=483 /DNA_ORIENTATION=-
MAAEAKKDTQPLAKPSKIADDTEFEEMSESYNVKGKSHKQIKCVKDDECKVATDDKKDSNTNKDSNAKDNKGSNAANQDVASGSIKETFESTDDKGGDHKPVTVKQGTAVTDLNVYNKKEDDKKDDK